MSRRQLAASQKSDFSPILFWLLYFTLMYYLGLWAFATDGVQQMVLGGIAASMLMAVGAVSVKNGVDLFEVLFALSLMSAPALVVAWIVFEITKALTA